MLAILFAAQIQQDISLSPGMVITRSASVMPAVYLFPNDNTDARSGTITIKGDNITVDFRNATLQGTRDTVDPDERAGTGVFIQGNNVTIKNLNVHGYKVGLVARNSNGLKLIDCDFSYNWKQRLKSTPEREDGSDWMSYHQNEEDEWLRYGAGIYLRNCDGFEVQNCTAVGGQNGLMMTECDDGLVWNSNFSFLSSIGIGMYRSSRNRIMHNNIDWCVRGYSHGVYNRGQDSAGILVYEQSNENVFAYNSVTHGGDGFFLWAGQTTMDTGKGGCNDNLLYGNDFSHAVTNGIEATFSRNNFVNNMIMECWHGIWGGYSYESNVIGNVFRHNAEGIAWEHGQDNRFDFNDFRLNLIAINLWQKESAPPNWGYPKFRDTSSRDNTIYSNFFLYSYGSTIKLSSTTNLRIDSNVFDVWLNPFELHGENPSLTVHANYFFSEDEIQIPGKAEHNQVVRPQAGSLKTNSLVSAMKPSGNVNPELERTGVAYRAEFASGWNPEPLGTVTTKKEEVINSWAPDLLAGGVWPFIQYPERRGRKFIIIDEWGPYDFLSPKLVWRGKTDDGKLKFDVLGPFGAWTVKTLRGVKSISAEAGNVPGELTVELESGKAADIIVELEYVGLETVDYRGIVTAKGRTVAFSYREFFAPIDWTVKWFNYDLKTQDPRETDDWKTIIQGEPVREEKTDRLAYAWGGSPGEGVTGNAFLTLAEGSFEIQEGEYVLELTSDDGVRVYIDGKLVHEDWTWHVPKSERILLTLGGKHTIRIEHFELDGYSTLKCELKRQ